MRLKLMILILLIMTSGISLADETAAPDSLQAVAPDSLQAAVPDS